MARRMPLRAQEIQDVSRLDSQVFGELLNLDTACCCRYGQLTSGIQLAMIPRPA
jgi:hypothetical protein